MYRAAKTFFQDGTVNLAKLLFRLLLFHAQDNAVGMQKILHCRAFSQKFRVRSHAELYCAVAAVDTEDALKLLSCLGWHRAFLYHQLRSKRFTGDHSRDIIDR